MDAKMITVGSAAILAYVGIADLPPSIDRHPGDIRIITTAPAKAALSGRTAFALVEDGNTITPPPPSWFTRVQQPVAKESTSRKPENMSSRERTRAYRQRCGKWC